jgi:hypothetical protein
MRREIADRALDGIADPLGHCGRATAYREAV